MLTFAPLDPLQHIHVLLVMDESDAGLRVGSHWNGVEGQNHLPCPAGHAAFDVAQDTVGLLGCKCTLPGHVELHINQHPQVLLGPFSDQPVFVLGIAPTCVQDFALGLAEFHEVCTSLSRSRWMASLSFSLLTTPYSLVLPANVLRVHSIPLSMSLMKMLNSTGPNNDPSGTPLVTDLHLDIELLTATLWVRPLTQFLIHWVVHALNLCLSQFRDEDVMQDSVKCFAQVQDRWHQLLLPYPPML